MPLNGWIDRGPLYQIPFLDYNQSLSSLVEGKMGIYVFDLSHIEFEPFVREIQNRYHPAVILFQATRRGGSSFAFTDGKQNTYDLYTPTISMVEPDFLDFYTYYQNHPNQNYTIYFNETNYYFKHNHQPHWNIMLTFPIGLSLLGIVFWIRNLYLYSQKDISFGNAQLALIFETCGNLIRLLFALDMSNSRLLFHHKISRLLISLHIPFSLATAAMIILYSAHLLKRSHKVKAQPFMKSKKLKISLIAIIIFMAIIQSITAISTFTEFESYDVWNLLILIIYGILSITFTVLFVMMSVSTIRIFQVSLFQNAPLAQDETRSRTKKYIRKFIIRSLLASIGYIALTLSMILTTINIFTTDIETYVILGRYYVWIGCVGLNIASLIHIHTYTPRSDKNYTYTSTTSKTKSYSKKSSEISSNGRIVPPSLEMKTKIYYSDQMPTTARESVSED